MNAKSKKTRSLQKWFQKNSATYFHARKSHIIYILSKSLPLSPSQTPFAPFPQSRLILGAGKQMAKGKWHCSNLGKSKKMCIHRKDALGDKLLPRSKNWWLEFLAPKDANNCFLRLKFFVGPKNWDRIKMFRGQPGKAPKDFFSQRKMDILECRFRIDLGLRCSTKSRYNSIVFPTLKSQ